MSHGGGRTASWRCTLASTSPGLRFSNSDSVPVFLCVFFHLSRPGGCKVWAGSGSRLLVFLGALPGGLEALNQQSLSLGRARSQFFLWSLGWTLREGALAGGRWVWVWIWLEASSFLHTKPRPSVGAFEKLVLARCWRLAGWEAWRGPEVL